MLWLALYLPALPLEVFLRGCAASCPLAVAGARGGRSPVLACNREARALGVSPGMTASAAWALAPQLALRERNAAAERTALVGIARWAGQFTPCVSLYPAQAVALEVAGSVGLFGGLDALLERARRGLEAMGYSATLACAPTPLGAWLFARAGLEPRIHDAADLAHRLSELPAGLLDVSPAVRETLRSIGAGTLGDCLRLPRAGLARRCGQDLLDALDRALGRIPDPRRLFRPPPQFRSRLELPAEVPDAEALLFAARRLLVELTGFLAARQDGVQRLELALAHAGHPATRVCIGLVAPSRDLQHLTLLLREHLAGVVLPAPVRSLVLHTREIRPLQPSTLPLFPAGREAEDWPLLVERLRNRLGAGAVHGLRSLAEHRPERAWRPSEPDDRENALPCRHRPLWLLAEPRPLETVAGQPCLRGPLVLLAGPERIESGWWDGAGVMRDYFLAQTRAGSRLWVFRERANPQRWYLQGVFG